MSAPALEGALAYQDLAELRLAWDSFIHTGRCFVTMGAQAEVGTPIRVRFSVPGSGDYLLDGVVSGLDVDAEGNAGLLIDLSPGGLKALEQLLAPANVSDTHVSASGLHQAHQRLGDTRPPPPVAAPAPSPAETGRLEAGALLDGRFQIEAFVAEGGMGEVYRATHVYLRRAVALKLLRSSFASDADMWSRFQREAELVSRLESPYIVRVFDFGRTREGRPYLAMEFVEGETVDVIITRDGSLPPERAVKVLEDVCAGLTEAHSLGIVHRDLKPANLITGKRRDGGEITKILDFGIARLSDGAGAGVTSAGLIIGTPAYLSPEQALGGKIDGRTDVYALGCVAYKLLTGRTPFDAETPQALVGLHLSQAPAPLTDVAPGLAEWPALSPAVLKALAKKAEDRYQDAASFAAALRRALTKGVGEESAVVGTEVFEEPAPPPPAADAVWPPPDPEAAVPPPAAPAAAPFQSTGSQVRAAESFFSEAPPPVAGAKKASPPSPLKHALEHLTIPIDEARLARHDLGRAALKAEARSGLVAWVEFLRVQPRSEAHARAVLRLVDFAADHGGVIDSLDEDGACVVFDGASLRSAVLVPVLLRESLAALEEDLGTATGPTLRAAVLAGPVAFAKPGAASGETGRRARQAAARTPPGTVLVTRALSGGVGHMFELKEAGSVVADMLAVGERLVLFRKLGGPLLGREDALRTLETRLAAVPRGLVPPMLISGESGSGRSAVVQELASRARSQSFVVAVASTVPSLLGVPFGALGELICQLTGVPPRDRIDRLGPALEALKMSPQEREAALCVAAVKTPAQLFTPRQAIASLRAVIDAGLGELKRPVLLVFDSLELMDPFSVDAFRELAGRGRAGEFIVGTATPALAPSLPRLPAVGLQPLTLDQLKLWATGAMEGQAVSDELVRTLHEKSGGLPRHALDWLHLLGDRGQLLPRDGAWAIEGKLPEVDIADFFVRRVAVLGAMSARILQAGVLCGDSFDPAALTRLFPKAPPNAWLRLASSGLLRALGNKRWAPSNPWIVAAALETPDGGPAIARRLLTALAENKEAQAAPRALRPMVAALLTRSGAGVAAVQQWREAAEDAAARRAPRELTAALRGWADALGTVPGAQNSPEAGRGRVELLSRAVSTALVSGDPAQARVLIDLAGALAGRHGQQPPELFLAVARVLRSEARRAKSAEALARAMQLAANSPVMALCLTEQGEAREAEGDLAGAATAYEAALRAIVPEESISRWHGEVNLEARVEARLAGVFLAQKDDKKARPLLLSALERWRDTDAPAAEARVLANLGALEALCKNMSRAAEAFAEAATAAADAGDFLLEARQLLQRARALSKESLDKAKVAAEAARASCLKVGWDEGKLQADGIFWNR